MDPQSLFSLNDHLAALSKDGDPLEVLQETVDFEYFRTIGIARAEAKLTLANLVYNFDRLIFHERRRATG